MGLIMFKWTAILILCALPFCSLANNYTDEQERILKLAYEVGSEIGWPETMQAIVMQETLAGHFGYRIGDLNLPVGKRSYGIAQVKVATARFVLNNYHELKDQYFGTRKLRRVSDEEIIVLLMTDDEACMVIAARNFELMLKFSKGRWAPAVAAYNQGWGRARDMENPRTFKYVKEIVHRIKKEVRPFNKVVLATSE